MRKVIVKVPGKPDESMLLTNYDLEGMLSGLIQRGTLLANTSKVKPSQYDIEYSHDGELFINDVMTGERIVECWY